MSRTELAHKVFKGNIEFDGTVAFNDAITMTANFGLTGDIALTGDLSVSGVLTPGDTNAGLDVTPNTGVAITLSEARYIRKTTLTLTAMVVDVTDANDYGGTKMFDMADANIAILAVETDLILTKDGTGYINTTDLTVGIGSAIATNTTLSGAMVDVIDITALTADTIPVDFNAHSNDNSTPGLSWLADSATLALYLNVAGPTEVAQDGALLCHGTVDLYWIDLGNVTS